jgi:WD40 repeat protein
VSISTKDSSLFISGSCVSTAKLWHMRTPAQALHTCQGQGGDVNTVQFLPDGHHFGTGSEDGVCHFFDTHMGHELQHYIDSMPPQGAIPMSPLLLSPIQDVSCLWAIPMPTATSGTPSG